MEAKLEKFIKKIEKAKLKIGILNDRVSKVEEEQSTVDEKFKKVEYTIDQKFLIPGLIGPDKKNNAYQSFAQFVKYLHDWTEEGPQATLRLAEIKLV